jgi:MFS family permease
MNSGAQFFTNLGWVFLAMWLSEFLTKTKGVGDEMAGKMTTIVLAFGIVGILVGGYYTDRCVRRWGVRWGRIVPLAGSRFLAAGCYVVGLYLNNPWVLMVAFGLVAFFADFGLPALWAGLQEMCGKHTPPLFGWSNMWGNMGAAIGTWVLPMVIKAWDQNGDWSEGLIFCAVSFVLSGLFFLGFNAEDRMPEEV